MSTSPLSLIAVLGLLAATALVPSGCAGVRDATRSAFNTDMLTTAAPELTGTQWILPFGESPPTSLRDRWSLVMFFDPG